MRELKVRYLWRKEWYYIDLVNDNTRFKFEAFECANKTSPLLLFSGLRDKNEKEIYEDDIIRTPHGVINLISFRNGAFGFHNPVANPNAFMYFNANSGLHKQVEVIGTRMENPELLTE